VRSHQEVLLKYTGGTKTDTSCYSCWGANETLQWYLLGLSFYGLAFLDLGFF